MTDNANILPPSGDITGIPEKKFEAVYNMLNKGRRNFGRPGANLTLLDDPEVKAKLPKGWKCDTLEDEKKAKEHAMQSLLAWMASKPAAVLVNGLRVNGVEPQVGEDSGLMDIGFNDHVLIIGSHVLIVNSHGWKGGKDEEHPTKYMQDDAGVIVRGSKPFPGSNQHIATDLQNWFDYLQSDKNNPLNLLGMVFIDTEFTFVAKYKAWWDVMMQQYWCLIEQDKLESQLDKWYDQITDEEKETISTDLVTQVVVKMCKPYDRRAHVINMKPLINASKL